MLQMRRAWTSCQVRQTRGHVTITDHAAETAPLLVLQEAMAVVVAIAVVVVTEPVDKPATYVECIFSTTQLTTYRTVVAPVTWLETATRVEA